MQNRFQEIFSNHNGKMVDKWDNYLTEWENIFSSVQDEKINLFEIGVLNGGSLEIWGKYFRNAENIIGCDNNESCRKLTFSDPRISVLIGDAASSDIEDQLDAVTPTLDIIIDDGSHHAGDIIKAFIRYFKFLNNHGVYIIEDLHTSYWHDAESGLNNPYSAISFIKRLSDLINYEHWQNHVSRTEFLYPFEDRYQVEFEEMALLHIHSIKFTNSMCIIQKAHPKDNSLGQRRIIGQIESITSDLSVLDGTTIHSTVKRDKASESPDIFSLLDQIENLEHIVDEKHQALETLNGELSGNETEIKLLKTKNELLQSQIDQVNHQQYLLSKSNQDLAASLSKIDAEKKNLQNLNNGLENKIKELLAENEIRTDETHAISQEMTNLQQEYEKIQLQMTNMEDELISYVYSKSWRWTRPFRKIMSWISGK